MLHDSEHIFARQIYEVLSIASIGHSSTFSASSLERALTEHCQYKYILDLHIKYIFLFKKVFFALWVVRDEHQPLKLLSKTLQANFLNI